MHRSICTTLGVIVMVALLGNLMQRVSYGESPVGVSLPQDSPPITVPNHTPQSDEEMSARIDEWLGATLVARQMTPAPAADDAWFPAPTEFGSDGRNSDGSGKCASFWTVQIPKKRRIWIDRCLDSPRHATHLATTWRRIILPADGDPQQLQQAEGLQTWLREQFSSNLRYDRLVAEFLSSTGDEQSGPASAPLNAGCRPGETGVVHVSNVSRAADSVRPMSRSSI